MEWFLSLDSVAHDHPVVFACIGLALFLVFFVALGPTGKASERWIRIAWRCGAALLLLWPLYRLGANAYEGFADGDYVKGGLGSRAVVWGSPALLFVLFVDNLVSTVSPARAGGVLSLIDRLPGK